MLLMFWSLDRAAVQRSRGIGSTNGAIDSAMSCHSIKVLLEIVEYAGMITDSSEDKLINEAAELQKHKLEAKRLISPLG